MDNRPRLSNLVNIHCDGQICKIIDDVPTEVHGAIWEECTETDPNFFKIPEYKRRNNPKLKHWDGKYRLYPLNTHKFRLGLLGRVCVILENRGFSPVLNYNQITDVTINPGALIELEPRPYQQECVDAVVE